MADVRKCHVRERVRNLTTDIASSLQMTLLFLGTCKELFETSLRLLRDASCGNPAGDHCSSFRMTDVSLDYCVN